MTQADLVDAIAVAGALLLTLGAGLIIGSAFGTVPAIGAAALVLGTLLIAYAIPASRSEETPQVTEEPER